MALVCLCGQATLSEFSLPAECALLGPCSLLYDGHQQSCPAGADASGERDSKESCMFRFRPCCRLLRMQTALRGQLPPARALLLHAALQCTGS